MSSTVDLSALRDHLVPLAREAGRAILAVYDDGNTGVTRKADDSPLTEADLASDRILSEGLRAQWPTIPIVSEESTAEPAAKGARTLFLVDPLDGTKEFLKRNGEFTVNVALVEDGRPLAGVVHAPALGLTYYGDANGATRWDEKSEARISTRRIAADLRVVGSRSHSTPETDAFLARLPAHEFIAAGSSLKLCRVAEAAADLYPRFGPTMPWDIAAGHAVLAAAGGIIERIDGAPLRYEDPTSLNPPFIAAGDPSWRRILS